MAVHLLACLAARVALDAGPNLHSILDCCIEPLWPTRLCTVVGDPLLRFLVAAATGACWGVGAGRGFADCREFM